MGKLIFGAAFLLVLASGLFFAPAIPGLQIHPTDQFLVKPLGGAAELNFYTPTNVTLWMGLAIVAIFALMVLGSAKRAIVPSRIQSVAELAYGFIYKMVEDVTGKDGLKFFPYIMSRCDQYVTNRDRTVVITSGGQRFPVRLSHLP